MKAALLLLVFIFFAPRFQKQTPVHIVGVWKVAEVIIDSSSPMANSPMVPQLKAIMENMTFNLKSDHHFTMQGGFQGQQMPEGTWQYDAAKRMIKVTPVGDKTGRLMNIMVSKDTKGQIFFKPEETPATLKMQKL